MHHHNPWSIFFESVLCVNTEYIYNFCEIVCVCVRLIAHVVCSRPSSLNWWRNDLSIGIASRTIPMKTKRLYTIPIHLRATLSPNTVARGGSALHRKIYMTFDSNYNGYKYTIGVMLIDLVQSVNVLSNVSFTTVHWSRVILTRVCTFQTTAYCIVFFIHI